MPNFNDLYPYKATLRRGAETFEHSGHAETPGKARQAIMAGVAQRAFADPQEELIGFEFNGKEMPVNEPVKKP